MERDIVHLHDVQKAMDETQSRLLQFNRGCGAFVSTHEVYGALAEEMDELLDVVREDNLYEARQELFDVAATAIFGIASIDLQREEGGG